MPSKYVTYTIPGDWTGAVSPEWLTPEGRPFSEYSRRKIGGRAGKEVQTVFVRKLAPIESPPAPSAGAGAAAPTSSVVVVEADTADDAVAKLTADIERLGVVEGADAGGEGPAMQEGGRRRHHRKSHKAGRKSHKAGRKSRKAGRKSHKAGRKGASRRSKSRRHHRK